MRAVVSCRRRRRGRRGRRGAGGRSGRACGTRGSGPGRGRSSGRAASSGPRAGRPQAPARGAPAGLAVRDAERRARAARTRPTSEPGADARRAAPASDREQRGSGGRRAAAGGRGRADRRPARAGTRRRKPSTSRTRTSGNSVRAARGLVGVAGDLDGQRARGRTGGGRCPRRRARRARGATGTVASLRGTSPRRICSRSPSRVTVKPPKVTIAPTVESSQASTSSAPRRQHDRGHRVRERSARRPPALASRKSCWTIWPSAASTGSRIPSWPAVTRGDRELAAGDRRLRRRPPARVDRRPRCRGRGRRAAPRRPPGVSAGSEISPPFLPAPVWTSTANTPNAPLQRALVDVDRLDPVEPDVRVLLRQQPGAVVDRLVADRSSCVVLPADAPADDRDREADAAVDRRPHQPAGVEPAAEQRDAEDHEQRERGVAQRVGGVDDDRRRDAGAARQASASLARRALRPRSRQAGDPRRAARRPRRCAQQRDRVAARGRVDDDRREPEGLLEEPAARCRRAARGSRERACGGSVERAVLDVDALVADVPAPARASAAAGRDRAAASAEHERDPRTTGRRRRR